MINTRMLKTPLFLIVKHWKQLTSSSKIQCLNNAIFLPCVFYGSKMNELQLYQYHKHNIKQKDEITGRCIQ